MLMNTTYYIMVINGNKNIPFLFCSDASNLQEENYLKFWFVMAERRRSDVHISRMHFFLVNYVGEGCGGLYKAPTEEERRKRKTKRERERDQIKFIDLRNHLQKWHLGCKLFCLKGLKQQPIITKQELLDIRPET